jgi:hypothetical protein
VPNDVKQTKRAGAHVTFRLCPQAEDGNFVGATGLIQSNRHKQIKEDHYEAALHRDRANDVHHRGFRAGRAAATTTATATAATAGGLHLQQPAVLGRR